MFSFFSLSTATMQNEVEKTSKMKKIKFFSICFISSKSWMITVLPCEYLSFFTPTISGFALYSIEDIYIWSFFLWILLSVTLLSHRYCIMWFSVVFCKPSLKHGSNVDCRLPEKALWIFWRTLFHIPQCCNWGR